MNKRLEAILSHIPDGRGIVDVGTDHAYIPCALARRGYPGRILASDIKAGPLEAARRSAREAGVEDKICFYRCDGLDDCDESLVDTVLIAGMGGDTICAILDRAEWTMDGRYTLVLQPASKGEVLRYWLSNNDYEIVEEDLVEDKGILYPILIVRFGRSVALNDGELYTGDFDLIRSLPLCRTLLENTAGRFREAIAGLDQAESPKGLGRKSVLESALGQVEEMLAHV